MTLERIIFVLGCLQFSVLFASALVPFCLDWKKELGCLSNLHRQMYWVYGGYIVLSIVAFGLISMLNSGELAGGSLLARSFCGYVAVFWGVRLCFQPVFDVKEHLDVWWKKVGYNILTCLFLTFVLSYGYAAFLRF